MRHRVDKLMKVKNLLASLPPLPIEERETVSSEEAVTVLAEVIGTLQDKGYSLERIAKILQENDIDLTPPLLQRHFRRAPGGEKKTRATATPKTPSKPKKREEKGTPSAATTPAPAPEPDKKSSSFSVRKDTDQI